MSDKEQKIVETNDRQRPEESGTEKGMDLRRLPSGGGN